jgi:hypothetical protein
MESPEYYRERAVEARQAAATSSLPALRERHERSAAIWYEMATRAQTIADARRMNEQARRQADEEERARLSRKSRVTRTPLRALSAR